LLLLSLLGIIWILILETVVVVNNVSALTSTRATTSRRSNAENRNPSSTHPSQQQPNHCLSTTTTTTSSSRSLLLLSAKTTKEEEADLISEMDARVLQSMLRDSNKLDLEQASNMKKLLERGVKKDENDEGESQSSDFFKNKKEKDDEEDKTYSSQVIKTLADTKFWKAFKRNAGEVLESVAIAATNQLEKGAKVLVGLGFFAWERAKQDAARALPTGGSASIPKPKQIFQIGDKSSYIEKEPEKDEDNLSAVARQQSLRKEFTTPGDEISAVSAEISKIFRQADQQSNKMDKSKDMKNPFFAAFIERKEISDSKSSSNNGSDNSPFYASSQLQSTANRGSGRLESAFKRKQKTQLAKEKENIAVKSNRLVSGAIDSAYQVRQEIKSETSVPGYKTKQLRASTVDVSKRIADVAKGAAGFLGGASSFILGNGSKDKDQQQQQLPSAKAKADPVEFLDDASYFAFKRERDDATSSTSPTFSVKQQDEIQALEYITAEVITDTDGDDMNTATVNVDTNDSFNFFGSTISQSNIGGGGTKKSKTSGNPFTTNGYLDNMDNNNGAGAETEYASATSSFVDTTDDDGLRQVTAEVILDDDFDESVFEQAKNVDNMSIEDLLEEARIKEEEDNKEPNIITKAALRSLDVVFLVVEKFISVVPDVASVTKRILIRVSDSKLKDSQGSCVGWEFHESNIRGDKRY
jgi:nucleoid DNA-binding protein